VPPGKISALKFALSLPILLLATCAPLSAHHGSALSYDFAKKVTLNATVTRFAWMNPHALLYVDANDDHGNVTHWTCELTSPGVLSRAGWTRTILKPGDKITLTMHPAISGTPLGLFYEIILPDGGKLNSKNIHDQK
jgi:hypothetical protein